MVHTCDSQHWEGGGGTEAGGWQISGLCDLHSNIPPQKERARAREIAHQIRALPGLTWRNERTDSVGCPLTTHACRGMCTPPAPNKKSEKERKGRRKEEERRVSDMITLCAHSARVCTLGADQDYNYFQGKGLRTQQAA